MSRLSELARKQGFVDSAANFARVNAASASVDELLDALSDASEVWPDPALLKALLDHGAAAVDPLIAVLNAPDAAESPKSFWAAMALCDLGDPRAAEPIVRYLFYLPDDELDVLEWLPDIYGQLGETALEPLYTVIADDTMLWYPQAAAIDTIANWVDQFPRTRPRLLATLHDLVARTIARAAGDTLDDNAATALSLTISALIRLRAVASRSLLEDAFAQGLVNEGIVIREALAELDQPPQNDRIVHSTFLADWTQQRKEALEEEARMGRSRERPTTIVLKTPRPRRPGRNDPCHCGSGKKYKKCCLNQDEKALR